MVFTAPARSSPDTIQPQTNQEIRFMKLRCRIIAASCALVLMCHVSGSDNVLATEYRTPPGPPPGTYTITPPADSIRIPFEVYKGEIRMVGRVNGKEARMLVDNGALWDQLLFFGSEKVDALGIQPDGLIQVQGAGAGKPVIADTASNLDVSFDGKDGRTVTFHGQPAVIMPYEPGKPNPWALTEGQVSSAFFKHFVVAFDFDDGIITLTRPDAFDPKGKGTEVPIKPGQAHGWTIPGTVTLHYGRRLKLDMTMDLGWDEPMAINTDGPHEISLPPGLEKQKIGSGAQGAVHGYLGRVRQLEIAGFTLRDVVSTYSTVEDGGAKVDEVMVGLGTLQRFHVIYDYQRHRMFLKPNRSFDKPFAMPEKNEY